MSLNSLNPANFNFGSSQVFIWLAIAIGIFIVFLLLREFICWYFKINQLISLLKRIERNSRPIKQSSLTSKKKVAIKSVYLDDDTEIEEESGESDLID